MVKPSKRQKALTALIKGKGQKGRTKQTKAKAKKAAEKIISKLAAQKGQGKGFRGGGVISATRAPLPRLLKMNTRAGLNMHGGVISGVTEIVPDLQLSAAENVAGTILYQTPIHPLLLAPGSRFADIAAMYDQYVFEELQLVLGSDIPFTLNGMIGGGLERDPGDPLPVKDGQIDVKKYMEHEHFHAESIANKRGIRFPQSKTAIRKSGRGPTSGYFFNRLPSTSNNLSDLIQGQLVVFVHTPLSSDGQFALADPISLGPLTMRWKIRMKEASEKNNNNGNADYWSSGSTDLTNPMGWTSAPQVQSNMAGWSTLGLETYYQGNQIWAVLPTGTYAAVLTLYYGTTGASDYIWVPYSTAQTDLNMLFSTQSPYSKNSSTNILQTALMRFQIKGPGTNSIASAFRLFSAAGSTTGWTLAAAYLHIIAMPSDDDSLLLHPDHSVRSLAWGKVRDGAGQKNRIHTEVAEALKLYGIEKKEELPLGPDHQRPDDSKYTKLIERAHRVYLKSKAEPLLKPMKPIREREEKKRPSTPDDLPDDWDEKEFQTYERFRPLTLRVQQDDEKSDRSKPAQKRAPSLKS